VDREQAPSRTLGSTHEARSIGEADGAALFTERANATTDRQSKVWGLPRPSTPESLAKLA
jgi:hypothetical protein